MLSNRRCNTSSSTCATRMLNITQCEALTGPKRDAAHLTKLPVICRLHIQPCHVGPLVLFPHGVTPGKPQKQKWEGRPRGCVFRFLGAAFLRFLGAVCFQIQSFDGVMACKKRHMFIPMETRVELCFHNVCLFKRQLSRKKRLERTYCVN